MPERPELMYLFFVAVKSGKLKQKYNLPFSLLALAGKGGKGKVWWTRAAETIHQSSALYASSIAGLLCVSVSACVVCCVAVLPCCVLCERKKKGFYRYG